MTTDEPKTPFASGWLWTVFTIGIAAIILGYADLFNSRPVNIGLLLAGAANCTVAAFIFNRRTSDTEEDE